MAKIIQTPTLETKRLILEPIDLPHAESLEKYFVNWNIIRYLNDSVPWPYPKGGIKEHIETQAIPDRQDGKALLWTIVLKENHEPVGRIDYRIEKQSSHQGDRGFWLAEPYWKLGLMTEAVCAVNDFVFNVLKHSKMQLQNYKDNEGSHRLKEKTGANLIITETHKWRGEDREVEIWELTAENWRKFKAKSN